ncbi:MAG TPA: metallopeptidase family protein [Dehalococcoidia bacterium]|nr:metallopeptidase family protein [Dehalococcoidia bacterium]
MSDGAAHRVARLMREALEDLPRQYADQLVNVEFMLRRAPSPRDRRRLGLGNSTLYGLYEGIPLTQRGSGYDRVLPDRVTLYWGTLVREFPEEDDLAREVRKTLYHEIAHYFGIDEEGLEQTSVR